ncbi:MAG: Nif3-like dinuclear metal center hexameric protein [Planctomycetota bacterium]|jgi:dinuclear metal center YbgI/SA1388 family protein
MSRRTPLQSVAQVLEQIAPLSLAESWDNVGLLAGDHADEVGRIMTCLTLTQTTLDEAIEHRADLVVVHHPIPFKPISRITGENPTGKLLLSAIRSKIAIYSIHTAWDNAHQGINRQWANALQLVDSTPLKVSTIPELREMNLGTGIAGILNPPQTIEEIQTAIASFLMTPSLRATHPPHRKISKLGIVCGSGGSMVSLAAEQGCDGFLTGEATYHQCLESEALHVAMIMTGHHASEFFGMQSLAKLLADLLPNVECFASKREASPF